MIAKLLMARPETVTKLDENDIVLQAGLVAMHWGWLILLCQPVDIIAHYRAYEGFLMIGNAAFWRPWSVMISVLTTVCLFPCHRWVRLVLSSIQVGWLIMIAGLFAVPKPITTAPLSFTIFAVFGIVLAVRSWKSGYR